MPPTHNASRTRSTRRLTRKGGLSVVALSLLLSGLALVLALGLTLGFGAFRGGVEPASGQTSTQGKVVVEEYLSLTCPHCAAFHREIYPQLAEGAFKDERVVFVYRDFPLDRLALQAALLARCGGEKLRGKLIGAMLDRQHKWYRDEQPQEKLLGIVALVGIDRARARACLDDKTLERAVLEEQLAGRKRYNISSVPSIVVAGKKISGDLKEKNITRAVQKSLDEL